MMGLKLAIPIICLLGGIFIHIFGMIFWSKYWDNNDKTILKITFIMSYLLIVASIVLSTVFILCD